MDIDITLTPEQQIRLKVLRELFCLLDKGIKVNITLPMPLHAGTVRWNEGDIPTVIDDFDERDFWDKFREQQKLKTEESKKWVKSQIDYIIAESDRLAEELDIDNCDFFDYYVANQE